MPPRPLAWHRALQRDVVGTGKPVNTVTEQIKQIAIYPNPASNTLTLKGKSAIKKIEIMDVMGKKMITRNTNDIQVQVDISYLARGLYLVKVIDKDNKISIEKFVKE